VLFLSRPPFPYGCFKNTYVEHKSTAISRTLVVVYVFHTVQQAGWSGRDAQRPYYPIIHAIYQRFIDFSPVKDVAEELFCL